MAKVKMPYVMDMKPGEYYWCSCGDSKGQPFCDGSHKGTGFHPQQVVVEEPGKIAFCNCKQTNHPPNCDGSHCRL